MQPSPDATRTVRDWVRSALAVEAGTGASPVRAMTCDTADLLAAVSRQRVAEVLDLHASDVDLPPDVAEAVARRRADDRRAHAVRTLEIGRVQRALSQADVRCLLVKGPALAAQTTGDPTARGRGDIDLFIAPADVRTAKEVLTATGWSPRRPVPVPGTWAWRHMLDADYEMTYDGPASTIDLHWRLDPTHHALPGFEPSWGRRVPVDVGGLLVTTLAPEDAFVHACHHAAKDQWRWLRSLVDVHRLARQHETWGSHVPGRVELSTLQVTAACLGLPSTVPAATLDRLAAAPRAVVSRALAAQGRPTVAEMSVPGVQTLVVARYRFSASRTPADLRRTAVEMVAPITAVAEMDDTSAWTAAPRLAWQRLAWFVRRLAARLRRRPDAHVRGGRA